MAIAGKVAITPKGEWNANTAYTKLDLVFYENASYVAIQPSTAVTPTNTAYWMLVVQSAGGADLEAIIDGTTQVGNARTLDGHGAEDFLPKSGGTIDGNLEVITDLEGTRTYRLANAKRDILLRVYADGTFRVWDATNVKALMQSTLDGTNTFNGTASGNLPLSGGGTVSKAGRSPIELKSTNSNNVTTLYSGQDGTLGELGFFGANNPTFRNTSGANNTLLHTGNKPTGTYTGNGSATERNIATNGIGNAVMVFGQNGTMAVVSARGTICADETGVRFFGRTNGAYKLADGNIHMNSADKALNEMGITYQWQEL